MSIKSINSSIQNPYLQLGTTAAKKNSDTNTGAGSAKTSEITVTTDTLNISTAGQAMASAAAGITTMLQPFDAGRALTADDKALIGYPNPGNPYVTSMAATISELREKGVLQGKMTSEYYKLKDGTQASVFELMHPSDVLSSGEIQALKSRMMAKFEEYKSGAADEISKMESKPSFTGAYAVDDYPQQLTADDIKVIDSFPSDAPYNLIRNSVAFAVEAARKSGDLKGPLTFEALVGSANNPGGLLANISSDIQVKIPILALKKAMASGAGSLKDISSDALAKLVRDTFLSEDKDNLSTSQTMRTKQMISAYAM